MIEGAGQDKTAQGEPGEGIKDRICAVFLQNIHQTVPLEFKTIAKFDLLFFIEKKEVKIQFTSKFHAVYVILLAKWATKGTM